MKPITPLGDGSNVANTLHMLLVCDHSLGQHVTLPDMFTVFFEPFVPSQAG